MTIDEAIKRLVNIKIEFLALPQDEDWQAIRLGIEALKAWQESSYHSVGFLLPGETDDPEE